MGDWIFHAILSMLVGTLGFIYFLNQTVAPPNKSIFEINVPDETVYTIEELPR